MVIEMNLDVMVGDARTVCEVQVPAEAEVQSYTPEERATSDSPGETACIEWTLHAAAAVVVHGVQVIAAGDELTVPPIVRADIEDRLIREAGY